MKAPAKPPPPVLEILIIISKQLTIQQMTQIHDKADEPPLFCDGEGLGLKVVASV